MIRTACVAIALMVAGPAVAQQGSTTPAAAADGSDKKICKRFRVTGSLAQTRKVCKTRMEWLRAQDESRDAGEGMRKPICTGAGCMGTE